MGANDGVLPNPVDDEEAQADREAESPGRPTSIRQVGSGSREKAMNRRIMFALTAGLMATASFHLRAQDTDLAAIFRSASDRIHDAMVREFTGDPDVDVVMAMIPHYEGSIEMARIALEYGKDPQIRQLAEHIVNDHRAERDAMLEWIESDGGRL